MAASEFSITGWLDEQYSKRKEPFIEAYIVNFMATYDANHCLVHPPLTCTYEYAKAQAKRAWKVYRDGFTKYYTEVNQKDGKNA